MYRFGYFRIKVNPRVNQAWSRAWPLALMTLTGGLAVDPIFDLLEMGQEHRVPFGLVLQLVPPLVRPAEEMLPPIDHVTRSVPLSNCCSLIVVRYTGRQSVLVQGRVLVAVPEDLLGRRLSSGTGVWQRFATKWAIRSLTSDSI